jgi:site-specific recombinase XerC
MDRDPIPTAARRHKGGKRKGKKRRRPAGLEVVERDGHWHVHGTIIAQGRRIRVRRSSRLPAVPERYEEADEERRRIEADIRGEFADKPRPGPYLSIAAKAYLNRKRKRALGRTTVRVIQEITVAFGLRRVGEILESEWSTFVDTRHAGNSSETRERFLNALLGFLSWCAKKPRRWGTVPAVDRDKEARNPRRRKKRAVTDLSPSLISFLLDHAAPHLAAQLWTEWSTGARVSSILHGCRLCDVILAEGREQIAFHDTKNGETVTAVLHPRAAQAIREYLKNRGRLHDREGPLFLTHTGKPYSDNAEGTQNKTAFNAMKRRARKALRRSTFEKARHFLERGDQVAAAELVASGRAAHRLIGRVTQHWFRHMLATRFRGDIKGAMEQGGWVDERSVMGYTLDAPEHRRKMVASFDDGLFGTSMTRDAEGRTKG